MGYKFVQVAVDTQEEFDQAFAHFASKGYHPQNADGTDSATPDELIFVGPGYVKYNEMLGYTWYSGMSLACIVEAPQYEPLFFKNVQGFVENF